MNKSNGNKSMEGTITHSQHLWAHGQTLRPTYLSPHRSLRNLSRSLSLERRQHSLPKSPRTPTTSLQSSFEEEVFIDLPQKRRLILKSPQRSWPSFTKRCVFLVKLYLLYMIDSLKLLFYFTATFPSHTEE